MAPPRAAYARTDHVHDLGHGEVLVRDVPHVPATLRVGFDPAAGRGAVEGAVPNGDVG